MSWGTLCHKQVVERSGGGGVCFRLIKSRKRFKCRSLEVLEERMECRREMITQGAMRRVERDCIIKKNCRFLRRLKGFWRKLMDGVD